MGAGALHFCSTMSVRSPLVDQRQGLDVRAVNWMARPTLFSVKGTFFWAVMAARTLFSQTWQVLMWRTILASLLRLWWFEVAGC